MIPMLGITGYSGTGKTTLLEKLLPLLAQQGIHTAVIKHTHHNVQLDKPGKDSWRMKEAGAQQVIMTCDQRWALMTETTQPVTLNYLAEQFDPELVDLILVEGFKQEPIAKIMLHRQALTKPLPEFDEHIIALALDYPLATTLPILDINQPKQIADFIGNFYRHL
ncbi:molybdopterin-guanine dinucleotide biosynthesis protein MobB [Gallibacterium melopsittaci]|uniref:Molybdopterin-guanine dinucleotide biosynthesis protein MobB n=1 Tax=Gallibacterium melopsittaci TaxID=516063 RepID=A0ABV6HX02_9PAST